MGTAHFLWRVLSIKWTLWFPRSMVWTRCFRDFNPLLGHNYKWLFWLLSNNSNNNNNNNNNNQSVYLWQEWDGLVRIAFVRKNKTLNACFRWVGSCLLAAALWKSLLLGRSAKYRIRDVQECPKLAFFRQDWARKVREFSVWVGYLTKWFRD